MDSVVVRPLQERDWEQLREVRLRALRTERPYFHSVYEDELRKADHDWRALARNADERGRVFGLFDGEMLVGITGAFTDRDDSSGRTARFGFTYIDPAYRGRRLTRLIYEARLNWVRSRPQFTKALVSHRRSNERSGRAVRAHGFVHVATTVWTWHDGQIDDELHYELRLDEAPSARLP